METALASWNDLRINQQLCDGVITTLDGVRFPIHRVILSAFSPYFRAYFTNSLNNGNPEYTELLISDVSTNIIRLILEFAYTKNCAVSTDNVHSILVIADRFSCDSLVDFCTGFILRNMTASDCISNLRFSREYFRRDLEAKAWQFLCDQMEQVMELPEFKNLTVKELTDLLSADELNVKQEETVFDAITKWIQVDPESRRAYMPQLLHCVRFGHVSIEYYMEVVKRYEYNNQECVDLLQTVDSLFETNEDKYYDYYRYCYFIPRVPNEVVFAFGGWSDGTPTNTIETFDKKSGCWYISNIKDQRIRAYHGVIALNSHIYVIGGFNGTDYFNTTHCFDPATYTWTEKACMHDFRCYVSICELNGEIYAIGGHDRRSRLSSAEKYTPGMNQWTMIAPLNRVRSDASAASLNNKIYVAGGFNGQEVMSSVEVYSPLVDVWDFVDCMSTPRSGVSLISRGHYIYAVGGYDGVTRLYSCERYSPTYNRWDPIADMAYPRSNMACVTVDNSIFVMGGFNGTTTIAYTECYDDEEDVWYETSRMNINRSALSACVCRGLPNAKSYTHLGMAVAASKQD